MGARRGPGRLIFLVGALALGANHGVGGASRGALLLGLLVSVIALLVRHRAPVIVLGLVLALSIALGWGPIVVLPVLLAIFNVAEYTKRSTVIGATLVAAAGLVATEAIHHQQITVPAVTSRLIVIGLAVAVALYLRARADYINGLRERAERLEREHELLAQQAVGEERVRIARELHDVVAHNVSLMVVQAQALAATGARQRPARGPRPRCRPRPRGAVGDAPDARRAAAPERRGAGARAPTRRSRPADAHRAARGRPAWRPS